MNYNKGPQLTVSQLKSYLKHVPDDVKICIGIGSDNAPAHYLLNCDGQLMIHSDCYMQNAAETNIKTVLSFNVGKENKMNYTTIEQSKKLIELGLNPDTADMSYPMLYNRAIDGGGKRISDHAEVHKPIGEDMPCWSLGALLKLIPNYMVYHIGNNKTHITFYSAPRITPRPTHITNDYDSIIDAAFEMVCRLLENSYIKKGK